MSTDNATCVKKKPYFINQVTREGIVLLTSLIDMLNYIRSFEHNMTNKIIAWFKKDSTKIHLTSAFHTFLTGFVVSIVPFLNTLDIQSIEYSILSGVFLSAVRAGVKALITSLATALSTRFR